MPLINLQTDLKSIKYGQDRPGGGDSGQPFITTDINTGRTVANAGAKNILRLFGINQIPGVPNIGSLLNGSRIGRAANEFLSGDELIRGGAAGAAQASLNDTLRIGLFFTSLPKGPLFVAKQVGLQLSNPRLEIKKGISAVAGDLLTGNIGGALRTLTGGLLQPTRIYNLGINTVAQVPVNAFGGHFYRHGVLPVQGNDTKYESVVAFNNNTPGSKNNRLVGLASKFNLGDGNTETNRGISNLSKARQANRKANQKARREVRQANKESKQAAINRRNAALAPTTPINPAGDQLGGTNFSIGAGFNWTTDFGVSNVNGYTPPTPPPPPPLNTLSLSDWGYNPVKKPKRNKLNIASQVVDSYIGGPGSTYGIGLTVINRYQFTEDADKYQEAKDNASANAGRALDLNDGQRKELTNRDILEDIVEDKNNSISNYGEGISIDTAEIVNGLNLGINGTYADLIKKINNNAAYVKTVRSSDAWVDGNKRNATKNDFTGSSGFSSDTITGGKIIYKNSYGEIVTINKSNWSLASRAVRVGSGRKDSINLTPLFKAGIGNDNSVVTIGNNTYTVNDLCKFRIEAIDGDDPSKSIFMIFRAYLTDLSDDVSADWNDIKYAGRGEKFYIYSGFSRKINISFKVAALSAKEMEPMYQKLNNLMGNLMPDYTPGNTGGFPGTTSGVMRGPLVRMTIGNWIDSQPGVLNSLSYKVPQDSPWEIALNEPTLGGSKEMVLPHIVEVNLSFTPIGSQTQGTNKTPNKASDTQHTSHIAQNYNGTSPGEPNYITGSTIETATFPGGEPAQPY